MVKKKKRKGIVIEIGEKKFYVSPKRVKTIKKLFAPTKKETEKALRELGLIPKKKKLKRVL